ncbi:MAG: T9SS type A sorting domain-containing protein [Ignavibacteria bacterium]|nr:T9SS type A sorting domain-containing protein [Ignavibacteria bacterium]
MKIRSLILACIFFISLNGYAIGNPEIENLLSAFSAKVKKGEVSLSWKVSNPKNLNKFKLECKKSSEGAFVKVDDILFSDYLKKETKGEETIYSFSYKDTKIENGVYFYRLTLTDARDAALSNEELKLGISDIPDFKLHQNTPNPFNPSTLISYELKSPSSVKLTVFTMTGQLVAKLIDEQQTAGNYTVEFNAMNYPELSTGIYFYKLETQYSQDIKKMILAK